MFFMSYFVHMSRVLDIELVNYLDGLHTTFGDSNGLHCLRAAQLS